MAGMIAAHDTVLMCETDKTEFKECVEKATVIGNMSEDLNKWNDNGLVSTIIGYIIFAVMFIYAVINIFVDIKKRGEMYAGYISDDM